MSSASHQTMSRHRNASMSSAGRSSRKTNMAAEQKDFSSPNALMRYFEPTAATASMFLYGQGPSVVVAHHDSLTIERRFSRHSSDVQLLAVDTQSDVGAGRLVVSYDMEMTAIVWDLMTGDEVARFASYETLTCAAWMRNGNVAFGNTQGNVILFEPTTSEHISARTIDQIAITALAPAADCRTFAIGYQNGSLLIATLQPRFTILHNLSTNRAPSPIVTLSWHASSSRQKADMLAVQTNDGDLRVWSVSKSYNSDDPAKIVRILKKTDAYQDGPNWMGWSKNGRIIQFANNETLSWDVRTKHVTHDNVPTLDHIRGLAVYGPGATLFTLGANNTVQQFDLNMPSLMVNNVQHPAPILPPSPPVSEEIQNEQGVVIIGTESDSGASMPLDAIVSESDEDHMSPLARIARHADPGYDRYNQDMYSQDGYGTASQSSRSQASSTISKSSVNSGTRGRRAPSVISRGMTENTYISAGSSLRSAALPPYGDKDAYSISSVGSASITSSSRASNSRHKSSRLRNEIPRSPEDNKVADLFKFTRSRLHDIPYKRTAMPDHSHLTNDDLRRQMLSIIFGWNKEVEDLVRDELSRHPTGSPSRILLSKWLGDIDSDVMTATSENMTSSDWMLLALSGIGGQASQHKLGRAYVQRLLENGDLHAAATIMLGMGDHNDAIEIYVSHRKYMEALILLCLFFPNVWERQAQVIKKWGEFAVQHGQQQLAIRCFACCGQESTEPWASPSAAQVTFQSIHPSIPEILSPPLSPPGVNLGPQRSIAKTSALKLITSFGDQSKKSKFFAGDDGQTPIAQGMTPIAESATTPGHRDPTTALLRPSERSAYNTPSTALPPNGFGRKRLPSIGELPNPVPGVIDRSRDLLVPKDASITSYRPGHARRASTEEPHNVGISLARAATASPMMMRENARIKDAPMPSPSPESFQALLAKGRTSRNGPRERKPDGMELDLNAFDMQQNDITSPEQSGTSARFHWPTRRRGPGSVASSVTSQSSAGGRSYRSNATGRSRHDYISSLDAASQFKKARSRERSTTRNDGQGARSRENSRTRRPAMPEMYDDRGRSVARQRTPKPAKQSPTSPVPMSPEDLINLSTPKVYDMNLDDNAVVAIDLDSLDPPTVRKSSVIRRSSPKSRVSSRASSRRRASPERRPPALDLRGRSNIHDTSAARSPSSPVPLSAPQQAHFHTSDDEEDYAAAVQAQEAFRQRHNKSASIRDPQSPAVGRHGRSESQRRAKTPAEPDLSFPVKPLTTSRSASRTGDLKAMLTERQLKKEAAARELEERRKSLARRPSAPPIPLPDHLSPILDRAPSAFELPQTTFVPQKDIIQRSHTADPTRSSYARSGNRPVIGLPATPKAMRLKFDSGTGGDIPKIPAIPASARTSPGSSGQRSPERPEPSPEKAAAPLTLLPSTVYSPPPRPFIERCMSAPIPEEPAHQRRQRGGSMSRKMSSDANASGLQGIDELITISKHMRRASRDDQVPPPPPPPPAPPVLRELQHLAIPPPPPPAPLQGLKPTVYGGPASGGTIEIVMDEEEKASVPTAAPLSEATVPVIAAPAPPSSRNGHRRGRSITESTSSLAGRFSRATERMRSASRGRHEHNLSRNKSPDATTSPYESIPAPPISFNAQAVAAAQAQQYQLQIAQQQAVAQAQQAQAQVERHPREVRANYHHKQQGSGTGLLESEMI